MSHLADVKRLMGKHYFGPRQLAALGFEERFIKPFRRHELRFSDETIASWGPNGHGLFAIPHISLGECVAVLSRRGFQMRGACVERKYSSRFRHVRRRWIMMDLAPYAQASKKPYEHQRAVLPHDSFIPEAVDVVLSLALYRERHGSWPKALRDTVIRTSTPEDSDPVVGKDATLLIIVDKDTPRLDIEPWRKELTGNADVVPIHIL